jgi:hypothetical protein
MEKRTEKRICYVASLVGIPLEVDKLNTKRWEYVRVKIGCKDITKVPAVVEGLMDLHFYDFIFQREVPAENQTKSHWNTWTRTTERDEGDNPSPKKHKKGDGRAFQDNSGGGNSYEAGTSDQSQRRKHNTGFGDINQEGGEKMTSLKSQRTVTRLTKVRKFSGMRVKERRRMTVSRAVVQVVLMS